MSAAIVAAVVGVAGTAINNNQQKKAAQGLAGKQAALGQQAQTDIPALNTLTQQTAQNNALMSAALEKQLTPEVPALRTAANNAVLGMVSNQDPSIAKSQSILDSQLGVPLNTPLLNSAIAKAQSDLALGGKLSADQQGTATRQGLATAGTVAPGSLGLGRDLTARDLGMTSYQVEQQRLQNASSIGGQELSQQEYNSNNLLNQIASLRAIHNDQFTQALSAAQYGQSIQQPTVGLDPSAVANLTIANQNALIGAATNANNIQGAQNAANATANGQMLGFGTQAIKGLGSSGWFTTSPNTTQQPGSGLGNGENLIVGSGGSTIDAGFGAGGGP